MKIIAKTGNDSVANVYIAQTSENKIIEFVESIQPPIPINDKWVLIISTLYGCPVACSFCDAGSSYTGKLSKDDILKQIDFLIKTRYPNKVVLAKKFKIQFARMGEPSFNMNVIDTLIELPHLYNAPGLIPTISTIAPNGTDDFFEKLIEVKQSIYKDKFQMQFSIHSTNENQRDKLIPIKKWGFKKISDYSKRFYQHGDRKITLNFALSKQNELDIKVLNKYFDPEIFFIKITPVNPTYKAKENNIDSLITPDNEHIDIIDKLQKSAYDVLLSIGEWEENKIGSNCGQYVMNHLSKKDLLPKSYTYDLEYVDSMTETVLT